MHDSLMIIVPAAVQLLIILLGAPLIVGIIKKLKARLQNRKGPPLLQPFADLMKLLKKEMVLSSSSS